jgi:hypothetical protein
LISSTDFKDGENTFVADVGDVTVIAAKSSCSVLVAFRTHTVLPISVTVAETWLAAASSRLTGDIPKLVACVFEAVTRLLRVASARSLNDLITSMSTSDRSLIGRRSNRRTSSIMAETALTTDFMGVRTRVGAFERPAVRRLSMAERKDVTWISRSPPSAATGSWSSSLGACKKSWDVATKMKSINIWNWGVGGRTLYTPQLSLRLLILAFILLKLTIQLPNDDVIRVFSGHQLVVPA